MNVLPEVRDCVDDSHNHFYLGCPFRVFVLPFAIHSREFGTKFPRIFKGQNFRSAFVKAVARQAAGFAALHKLRRDLCTHGAATLATRCTSAAHMML